MLRRTLLVLVAAVVLVAGAVLASAAVDQPSHYYRDAVVVEAPREAIWALLTDFDGYSDWNPYITSASGTPKVGSQIDLRFEPEGGDAATQTGELLVVKPRRKLEWRTRTLVPGLLDYEQVFRVLPLEPGRFRIVQEARFEGLLAPFSDLEPRHEGLARMVAALAERASASLYQSSSP